MQFIVIGVDGPKFGSTDGDELHEAHWAYIDGWSEALVARGPTVTADGESHTGSVHVMNLPTAVAAQKFASEEPYARAGWYSDLTVSLVLPCTQGTMWDHGRHEQDCVSSIVRADLGNAHDDEDLVEALRSGLSNVQQQWLYFGVTSADREVENTAVVGLVDLAPTEAERALEGLISIATNEVALEIVCHRWRRGGRPKS